MKAFTDPLEFALRRPMDSATKHLGMVVGCSAFLLLCPIALAETRSSADYEVLTETTESDGGRGTSADYANDAGAGDFIGISSANSGDLVEKAGYIGQLYDVTGLAIDAAPASVNESATVQLGAAQLLDDETRIALGATDVAWSVQSGPLTGIDSNGLATAGLVYQNTAATVQADYAGATGELDITVLDTIPDNFGTYAADGLGDDWQVQHFGENNPLAAPLLDPDGDGQNNRFEHTAGLVPTDPLSRFLITIAPVPGETAQKQIAFSPLVPGRSYVVKSSPDLNPASWTALTGTEISDDGNERTVTDTSATTARKFYTVEIKKP